MYEEHRQYIFRLCFKILRNRDDAEDMVQEVFLHIGQTAAGETKPRFALFRAENGCQFRTWLHRVAANLCFMRLRQKNKWARTLSFEQLMELNPQEVSVGSCEPAGPVPQHALGMTIEREILEMPPGYRTVAVLRLYFGMEHQEVAKILGVTVGCSKSQTYKAMQRLREALKEKPACM